MSTRAHTLVHALGIFLWLSVIAAGFFLLEVYSHTPGRMGSPPSLNGAFDRYGLAPNSEGGAVNQLVMAIHPKCPCTRATLAELERLIAKCGQQIACTILVYRPVNATESWHETGLFATAQRLPQTRVMLDVNGQHAKRLQLKTSGAAVLYSVDGNVVFSGGITPARGHEGDNLGADAIVSLVRTGKARQRCCSVYGCPLERPARQQKRDSETREGA